MLLYAELFTFSIEKPTQMSIKQVEMDQKIFPAISICLIDGLDSSPFDEMGYDSPIAYFTGFGRSEGIPFFGWVGEA